jgi:type IV pilus assembly protein PilC
MNIFPFKKINKKIPALHLALFFRQLSALISAGVPIFQGLDILRNSQANKTLRKLLSVINMDLEAGNELSWCLSQFPTYFDTFTCHLIKTAEQSGTLSIALERIAQHKEKILSIKNKIRQALFYPITVMVVALVVSLIMLTVVIPRFAELFQNMHSPLPAFTQIIIHLSEWLRHDSWLAIFPMLIMLLVGYYYRDSAPVKYRAEQFLIRVPVLGSLYMKIILSRFCRTLATTFVAGIPIDESLKTIAHANGSYTYAHSISKLRVQIIQGQQLYQAMQKQLFYPVLLIQMVKIGEESGTLEKMLEKTAAIYEADIDHWLSICGHLLEPLIIAILGVLIGGLVIAMYLPIFKLGTVM